METGNNQEFQTEASCWLHWFLLCLSLTFRKLCTEAVQNAIGRHYIKEQGRWYMCTYLYYTSLRWRAGPHVYTSARNVLLSVCDVTIFIFLPYRSTSWLEGVTCVHHVITRVWLLTSAPEHEAPSTSQSATRWEEKGLTRKITSIVSFNPYAIGAIISF